MLGHFIAMRHIDRDSSPSPGGIARCFHDVSALVGEIDEKRSQPQTFLSNRADPSAPKDFWTLGGRIQSGDYRSSVQPAKRASGVFHGILEREGPRVRLPSRKRWL